MKISPLVSVITPMFNSEKYIGQTIRSVLNQTYDNWEMIIVDDSSTDDSRKLVKKYSDKDKRIKLIELESNFGGPARPRNIGIKHSEGEYIAFLDSDDLWIKEKLRDQVDFLQCRRYEWSYCLDLAVFGDTLEEYPNKARLEGKHCDEVGEKLFENNFIACSSTLIHKSVFDELGLFNENRDCIFAEDWEMWLRIAYKYPVGFLPKFLVLYRIHDNNNSVNRIDLNRFVRNRYVIDLCMERDAMFYARSYKTSINNHILPLLRYFVKNDMKYESNVIIGYLDKRRFFSIRYFIYKYIRHINYSVMRKLLLLYRIMRNPSKIFNLCR